MSARAEPFVIAENGEAQAKIVIGEKPMRVARFAAAELQHVVRLVAGAEVPFDQHWLLAQIAPRLLYVNSAQDDVWAGPAGERRALELAEPAWAVYGKSGCTAYHCRAGEHDLRLEDWNRFMDFTDAHGWREKEK